MKYLAIICLRATAALCGAHDFAAVDISSVTNANIRIYTSGGDYIEAEPYLSPAAPFMVGEVPFQLSLYQAKPDDVRDARRGRARPQPGCGRK